MDQKTMFAVLANPDRFQKAVAGALQRASNRLAYLDTHRDQGYLGEEYVTIVSALVAYYYQTKTRPEGDLLHSVAQHPNLFLPTTIRMAHTFKRAEVRTHTYVPHDVGGARRAKGDLRDLGRALSVR